MIASGLTVERHHHEVATAGQTEIDLKFAPLIQMADSMQLYKYIVKNVAAKNGKTATFMPKPLFEDNGSGMHVHQSLWKDGQPLFAGEEYAGFEPNRTVVCWRDPRPHQLPLGDLCSDNEFLSSLGARL